MYALENRTHNALDYESWNSKCATNSLIEDNDQTMLNMEIERTNIKELNFKKMYGLHPTK